MTKRSKKDPIGIPETETNSFSSSAVPLVEETATPAEAEATEQTVHHIEVSQTFLENLHLDDLCDGTRDEILSWFQNPNFQYWQDMNEQEQRQFARNIQDCVRNIIRSVTSAVAAAGYDCFPGHVEQVTVKDDIKLVIKASNDDENYSGAGRVRGKRILIVNVDANEYAQSRREAKVEPDQPDLLNVDEPREGEETSVAEAVQNIWDKQAELAEAEGDAEDTEEPEDNNKRRRPSPFLTGVY